MSRGGNASLLFTTGQLLDRGLYRSKIYSLALRRLELTKSMRLRRIYFAHPPVQTTLTNYFAFFSNDLPFSRRKNCGIERKIFFILRKSRVDEMKIIFARIQKYQRSRVWMSEWRIAVEPILLTGQLGKGRRNVCLI